MTTYSVQVGGVVLASQTSARPLTHARGVRTWLRRRAITRRLQQWGVR
jgi:hypothetical protein